MVTTNKTKKTILILLVLINMSNNDKYVVHCKEFYHLNNPIIKKMSILIPTVIHFLLPGTLIEMALELRFGVRVRRYIYFKDSVRQSVSVVNFPMKNPFVRHAAPTES